LCPPDWGYSRLWCWRRYLGLRWNEITGE
jgi:hypothetical protein